MNKIPGAKTMARIAEAPGGEVIAQSHERLSALAQKHGVVKGRKVRVDTTVVETNIHYPTDSACWAMERADADLSNEPQS